MPELERLFSNGLPLLYGAHQQGAKQASANHDTSTSSKLRHMLKAGAQENLKQARRLEQVFRTVGLTPKAKPDKAMQGIIDSNNALIAQTRDPAARDLINIELGQIAAHFYLATYGTMRTYAEAMGNDEAADLLQTTLGETQRIDKDFSKLARRLISRSSSGNYPDESALYTTAAMHPAITTVVLLGLAAGVMLAGLRGGTPRSGTQPRSRP